MDNNKTLGRSALRIAALLLVGTFCISNGIFDWFRLQGFEGASTSHLVVQIIRAVCLFSGIFVLLMLIRSLLFMKSGELAEITEVRTVAAGGKVICFSVDGRDFEKAFLSRPTWLFGKPLQLVVYDPANPQKSMVVYDWMLPWGKT